MIINSIEKKTEPNDWGWEEEQGEEKAEGREANLVEGKRKGGVTKETQGAPGVKREKNKVAGIQVWNEVGTKG